MIVKRMMSDSIWCAGYISVCFREEQKEDGGYYYLSIVHIFCGSVIPPTRDRHESLHNDGICAAVQRQMNFSGVVKARGI